MRNYRPIFIKQGYCSEGPSSGGSKGHQGWNLADATQAAE